MLHEHGAAGVAHDEVGVVVDRLVRAIVLDRLAAALCLLLLARKRSFQDILPSR
ncbi:hypothetical protein T6T25_31060 [Pseudomonas aeruginosa]|uniref:hypothetical protein n=1 Tax=Pseudomonas aeruginosa TaxID=287 RepID=UPI002E22ECE0|nr:hypothetical protein [Pseudomonas aeruginosa]